MLKFQLQFCSFILNIVKIKRENLEQRKKKKKNKIKARNFQELYKKYNFYILNIYKCREDESKIKFPDFKISPSKI